MTVHKASVSSEFVDSSPSRRQAWLGVLARSTPADVAAAWAALGMAPQHQVLRPAETGLVMVRGRAGGEGSAFNLGEMTATRCVVRLDSGETGVGYVAGRNKTHALTAALVDALLQSPEHAATVEETVIRPLEAALERARTEASRKAAATRVEFFTMVRDRAPKP